MGSLNPFRREGFSRNLNGSYTFNGTHGDDQYTVSQDASGLTVTNDQTGRAFTLDVARMGNGVRMRTQGGDDRVTIDGSVRTHLEVQGGRGNDRIDGSRTNGTLTLRGGDGNDTLIGGRRDDDINGGAGRDMLFGKAGNDALAGADGDDLMFGGDGNDQLLGQNGSDAAFGGNGHDFIQGGQGADRAYGGRGGDNIYADKDDTRIDAGSRYDAATRRLVDDGDLDLVVAENGAAATSRAGTNDVTANYDRATVDQWLRDNLRIRIWGNEDFQARTRADLGVMLSTQQGRGLLSELSTALDNKGERLTLEEKVGAPGGTYSGGSNTSTSGSWSTTYSDGTNRMPLPASFHELVHAYQDLVSGWPAGRSQFGTQGSIRNVERQATGLPWMDASGNTKPADELRYTDNQFRAELGLPQRTTYGGERGAPTRFLNDSGGHHDHNH